MKADALSRTLQDVLTQDITHLTAALALDSSSARIEVQSLLQRALNVSRAYLLAYPERRLDDTEQTHYAELLQRRLQGEPIAYILGEREFFGLKFKVTPATLIPRPETELLVELALQQCGRVAASPPGTHRPPACGDIPSQQQCRILDLGTGSGAIALSIAHARPAVEVVAVDASTEALAVAGENAQRLGIYNANFVHGHWYSALGAQRFDLIVSNPPYIAADDTHLQQGDLRFEPLSALASGSDGLEDIRHIVTHARTHLNSGGWLLLEHGYDQAAPVRNLLQQAGFGAIFSACDLAGIERVSGGCLAF